MGAALKTGNTMANAGGGLRRSGGKRSQSCRTVARQDWEALHAAYLFVVFDAGFLRPRRVVESAALNG